MKALMALPVLLSALVSNAADLKCTIIASTPAGFSTDNIVKNVNVSLSESPKAQGVFAGHFSVPLTAEMTAKGEIQLIDKSDAKQTGLFLTLIETKGSNKTVKAYASAESDRIDFSGVQAINLDAMTVDLNSGTQTLNQKYAAYQKAGIKIVEAQLTCQK